jgi:peroxiredoxin
MKPVIATAAVLAAAAALATPAFAELKPGAAAPDFTAPAFLGGSQFTFKLADALKKGPVVVYFFPAAHTTGCNIEAHLFSEAIDQFKAEKTTVIGVTGGNIDQLSDFSKETQHCGGKIAAQYDTTLASKGKADWSGRTSYVIGKDGKVAFAYDNLNPNDHVNQTLAAVKTLQK